MNTLFVGFKGVNNASNKLVSLLNGDMLFLTNSFDGLAKDIQGLTSEYSEVYMFGIDKNLTASVRIESCAERNGCILTSNLFLNDIVEMLRINGVRSSISDSPTKYLCNDAYFRMLERVNGNAVFIHIPSGKNMSPQLLDSLKSVFKQLSTGTRLHNQKKII